MIMIIGGGMVGLTFAALMARADFEVAIVESGMPSLSWQDVTAKVSAIHLTSIKLFSYLKIWETLPAQAISPLKKIHVWDHAHSALHFDSKKTGLSEMGAIIENRALIKSLWEFLQSQKNVTLYCPAQPNKISYQDNKIILTLDDGATLTADLMVGADGGNSWVRAQLPFETQTRSYLQKAITAVVRSDRSHHHTAYQKFLETGPVALLPLYDACLSALIWSADNAMSDTLLALPEDQFDQQLIRAFDHTLGELKTISMRNQFPLIMRHVDNYVCEKAALMGDAAHTIHPLAGQGVNLGLMDAACLAQVLIDARCQKKLINDLRVLRRYARWRRAYNSEMIFTMRALQEILASNTPSINFLRRFSVNFLDKSPWVKNAIMRAAMGESRDLPHFLASF